MRRWAHRVGLMVGFLLGGTAAGAPDSAPASVAVRSAPVTAPTPPALMLAGRYTPGIHLADYWVSEKLDGVRGHWTGTQLVTRGGLPLAVPTWFTSGWPNVPMDGELWAGRGRFAQAVSTVRRETPDDDGWRQLRFMVFDLPGHGGPFDERVAAMQKLTEGLAQPWVQAVLQQRVANEKALMVLLRQTEREGGEGLMLHRGAAFYQAGRSDDILKMKTHDDAEAQVVGWVAGKGKYEGLVGALLVQTPQGQRFKLGSGLNDRQRREPPPPGVWVTYRYRGFNASGLPRFATFLRVREDADLNAPPPAR